MPGYGKDLTIVVRGVSFSSPGSIAIVWADHLQKDLSELALVQNQDYHDLVQWVEAVG